MDKQAGLEMNYQNFRRIFVFSAKQWPVGFNIKEFKKSWLRFFLTQLTRRTGLELCEVLNVKQSRNLLLPVI